MAETISSNMLKQNGYDDTAINDKNNSNHFFEKYKQIKILVIDPKCVADPLRANQYFMTELPKFDEIKDKLYRTINKDKVYYFHSIDDKMLDELFQIPIKHQHSEPTVAEILEQIPYIDMFESVYLYLYPITTKGYDFYVTDLAYNIQTGIWVKTNVSGHDSVGHRFNEFQSQYQEICNDNTKKRKRNIQPKNYNITDNSLIVKKIDVSSYALNGFNAADPVGLKIIGKTLDEKELMRRYNITTPVLFERNPYYCLREEKNHTRICTFGKPLGRSIYTGQYFDEKSCVGIYDVKTKDILTTEGKIYAKYIKDYPTFHTFASRELFKPDFEEVLTQLPDQLFADNKKILTSTLPVNYTYYTIGDYHAGVTTVWQIL